MPLSDQAVRAQTGSLSLGNSEPIEAAARSTHQGSSSNGSTQPSSSKPLLTSLPHSARSQAGRDQVSPGPTRTSTPEPLRLAVREIEHLDISRGRSSFEAKQAGGGTSAYGQAPLEQAGKARITASGRASRRGGLSRREEERDQARTGFAAATFRRFKAKLEGLTNRGSQADDGNGVAVLTVEEQVEKLLQQATSRENLARMYEGWTPWI